MSRFLTIALCLSLIASQDGLAEDASLSAIDAKHLASQRAKQAEVMQRLSETTDVQFVDTPLSDAMQFLGVSHRLNFAIDSNSLADIGISTDDTFTLSRQQTPVRNILDDILQREILDLDWYADGDVVRITSVEEAEYAAEVRVYDVSDFLPRSNEPFADLLLGTVTGSYTSGSVCAAPNSEGGEGFFLVDSGNDLASSSVNDIAESPASADEPSANQPPIETKPADKAATGSDDQTMPRRAPSSGARSETEFYDFMPFIDNIMQAVTPETWDMNGGAATIGPMVVNGKPVLIIRTFRRSHEGVADLLEMLRLVAN